MLISTTQLIHSYHHFDKDFWLSYKTLEKLHPNFDSIKMSLLKSKRIDAKVMKEVDEQVFTTERQLLQAEWESKNEEAKQTGITTHEYIRNLFCTNLKAVKKDFLIDTDQYNLAQMEQFLSSDGIFIEHRLELPLEENYSLVGIPDCFIIHDGIVDIYDWKVCEDKIKFKSVFDVGKNHSKKMKYPLSSLDDCDGIQYQLQLSIYMWIILKLRPELKPGTLKIVQIKDRKVKNVFEVPYMEKEVKKLIPWHLKNTKLNKALFNCREIKY